MARTTKFKAARRRAMRATALSALVIGSGAAALDSSDARASASAQDYAIPAGPVATALNRIADASGAVLVYDASLTRKIKTQGLAGRHTLDAALGRVLAGTGLTYRLSPNGTTVAIMLAQNDTGAQSDAGGEMLPVVEVEGNHRGAGEGPGSSQEGAGLGGRFTGYTVDFNTPAVASKDNIPILQSPVNIQVVPREVMDDQQDITVKDAIVGYVSSVQPTANSPDSNNFYDGFSIRGIDNVSIFRNNLRVFEITNIETANLQSIEVLKGPAAMLFGRLEPGGIVNLVVKRPLETPYFSVQEQLGSWSLTRTTVDATGPMTDDKTWLYRVNLDYTQSNSFINFVRNQNAFIGPTITYHPIEQFRFNLDAEYQNTIFVDTANGLPAVGSAPALIPISRYLEVPAVSVVNPNRQERELIGYDWTFDIFPDWSLTNRFAYNNIAYRQLETLSASLDQPTGLLQFNVWDAYVSTQTIASNLDLNGKFQTGPLNHALLLGTDFWDLNKNIESFFGPNPTVGPMNIYAPVYNFYGYVPQPNNGYFPWREQWKGVYAQDMVSAADNRLHLLFGGRYDWAGFDSGYSPTSNAEAVGPCDPNTGTGLQKSFARAFSPRLGAVAQPAPWLSFYGNFTESLGISNVIVAPGQPPLAPQRGIQYEGGAKAELFGGRLTAALAFYSITKSNIPQQIVGSVFVSPVGLIRSQGAEFDLTGRINETWSLIASYSHDDARILNGQGFSNFIPGALVNESGNRLLSIPLNAGSIWVKYDASGDFRGLSFGGGVVVVGERQGDNQNDFQLPGYARVDSMIMYQLQPGALPWVKNLTAQLNVKNLFNTTYYQSSSTYLNIYPGAPRTFLVSLRAEF
jgi:iron complex outermembrane receptor protein